MRVAPVVGRPAAHDLEAVPPVEANVGHCHLGGHERQAAKAARSRHLFDPLQQPAPDAGALLLRIDSDLGDVEVFLLRFRPDGTNDALTVQSDVDVAALEFRRKSLPLFGKLSRSVGRKLAPQSADIGRKGCAYDAPDLFALRKHRGSEGQHHGRRIPNKTPASATDEALPRKWCGDGLQFGRLALDWATPQGAHTAWSGHFLKGTVAGLL